MNRQIPTGAALARRRIYLVDDQPLVREWLTCALSLEPDMAVCGEAATVFAAMRDIATCDPHAAIIDISFEDGSGFDLIERIRNRTPQTAILVLSAHDELYYAQRVLRAGAKGYISKREPTRHILAAIRRVLQGKLWFSQQCMQSLVHNLTGESSSGHSHPSVENLSDRELEVFSMIGRGCGPRRIAEVLHISPKTVQAYCERIKEKLRLRDAIELHHEAILWMETIPRRPVRVSRKEPLLGFDAII
jgi:DNA-binding NarL/FixJ family response regulator